MGVEYYAINIHNKTFYDLGKGAWYALTDMEAFQDEEYLCHEILSECYYISDNDYWAPDEEKKKQETIKYVKTRIAPDLFHMMKDTPKDKIKIVNDCGDDITVCRSKGYRCVGTRYYDLGSKEYEQSLKFLNRHLEDTAHNRRMYNPENFRNCIDFNVY